MRPAVVVSLVALVCGAAFLGFACGHALSSAPRRAPSRGVVAGPDDGDGFLARASRSLAGTGGLGYGLGRLDPDAATGGASYGASYGGTIYGNYRFVWPVPTATFPRLPGGRGHAPGYRTITVSGPGSVVGQVEWTRASAGSVSLAVQDSSCPAAAAQDSVSVQRDDRGHVTGALVYLATVERGRGGLAGPTLRALDLQLGGTLRERDCRFVPRLQIVSPIGATLSLQGDDVTARPWVGRLGDEEVFRVSMVRGAVQRVVLGRAGILEVRDEVAGTAAWVVVASHPYYAVTGEGGRFRLDEVPPGKYTLVAWHPPVAYRTASSGVAVEPAVTVKREVVVRPRQETEVTLRLPGS